MQKRWQFVSRFKRANEGPKSRQQRRTEAAAIVNLGVVDTVNGRRMKRRGLTGSPSAARGEKRGGEGRYRVQGETDGWHKGEASECVWLSLLLPEGKGQG